MELKREYYSLEEAANLLEDYSIEDLDHFIEIGKIEPCLYSSTRKYVAATWDAKNRYWIAHATCFYRGLLKVHKSWVESLWDKGEINLSKASSPVDRSSIRLWDTKYPYKGKSPSVVFDVWEPMELTDLENKSVWLIPFATEGESLHHILNKVGDIFVNQLATKENGRKIDQVGARSYEKTVLPDSQRYAYGFDTNGKFNRDDLRLLPLHINALTKPIRDPEPQYSVQVAQRITQDSLPWNDSQKGGTRINEPLERLFRHSPDQPAKNYWRLLREGYEKFDQDQVIEQVTNGEIHWFTFSDEPKVMTYKTFENKISKIKKFYRDNEIEVGSKAI